jgi:hypothetical protein
MRTSPSITYLFTLSAALLGMTATNAHAYLDAGTGSMILQVLLGGVAGAMIAGKLYWHKFLTTIRVRRDDATDVPPKDPHT